MSKDDALTSKEEVIKPFGYMGIGTWVIILTIIACVLVFLFVGKEYLHRQKHPVKTKSTDTFVIDEDGNGHKVP